MSNVWRLCMYALLCKCHFFARPKMLKFIFFYYFVDAEEWIIEIFWLELNNTAELKRWKKNLHKNESNVTQWMMNLSVRIFRSFFFFTNINFHQASLPSYPHVAILKHVYGTHCYIDTSRMFLGRLKRKLEHSYAGML